MGDVSSRDKQVTMAGKTWTLRMSIKAVMRLKDHWKLGTDEEVVKRLNRPGLTDVAALVWAGLATHHPDVSLDEVIDAIDEEGLASAADATNAAIAGAVQGEFGTDTQNPPAKAAADDAD